MNEQPSPPTTPAPPPLGQERLPGKAIAAVLVGALVVFILGVFWADALKADRSRALQAQYGQARAPAEIGEPKIGLLEQELFEMRQRAPEDRARKEQRLNSYGWVDRDRGIIHIPIERAMEQVLAEQKR